MDMETQTAQLTEFILPWVGILISLIIAVWVKDIATGLAKGLKFQMNKAFNEGDKVLLEGDDAVIIKIGISETVFGVYSDKGYIWRYVPNERIHTLKLEKIINPDLHLDTDREKAEKIQSLIDANQDTHIVKNREAIENLKNGK
jgi:small-conductance mechanosensitive channel